MPNYEDLEKEAEKKFKAKDKRKSQKMHVSGKNVFTLQQIIKNRYDRTPKRTDNKKNG